MAVDLVVAVVQLLPEDVRHLAASLFDDDVPPQPEKPKELQMSELADKLNTSLSPEAKQIVINSIKKAIHMKKQENLIQ